MAPLVLNLFLVTVLLAGSAWTQSTPGSGTGSTCNPLKTMGGVNYTLIEETETEDWGCSSDCVYRKQGVPSEKWCFKPGGSSVTCGLSKYTEEECPELVAFQKATMSKDEELYLVLKDLIKCCKEKPQASSNETYINQTIINLNETVNNLICNVNHISTTQQTIIKGFTRMSEVMARLDQHGAQCGYKAMWEQAKTIITFDNTFTNDGVGSLDAATGMWTAGVSGTYAISISGYSQHDFRGENMLNLFKNGASLGKKGEWMFAEYGKDSGGRSLVLKLAKDDKLTLKAGDMASATANNNKTFIQDLDFCVFLINADSALTKANTTDWPANECPASLGSQPLIAVSATMSSTYEKYLAKNCIDRVLTGGRSNLCHTNPEKAPWLAIDFGAQVLVEKVVIHNRDDCCGERLKNAEVRVADQLPASGQDMFSGGQHLATFKGPAKTGEVVTLTSTGHVGRFVIVQLDQSPGTLALNLHEVTVWGRKQASPAVQGSGHL